MAALALDTLATVKDLRGSGFTEAQAEAVTRVVRQASDAAVDGVVTEQASNCSWRPLKRL